MSVNNFSIKIKTGKRELVNIDSYRVHPAEITFLFGESGIGKSLISRALYGLLDPDDLNITISGAPYSEYLHSEKTMKIQKNSFFVFQEPSSHLNPLTTLKTQLNEGDLPQSSMEGELLSRMWNGADSRKIDQLLSIYPKPYRPSGGEKQRILLTMAFKKIDIFQQKDIDPEDSFFVFDEPTGSLDNRYRNIFLDLLFNMYQRKPFSALIITHDYSIINEIFKNHRDLLPKINFSELTRDESGLSLNEFSPERFITWLNRASMPSIPRQSGKNENPVLRLKAGISVFNYRLSFSDYRKNACDLTINAGEMVYLKAPSGMGKTTIAKIIMGLISAQNLNLEIFGNRISDRTSLHFYKRKIWGKAAGLVFQHADEALNLKAAVKDVFKGLPAKNKRDINKLLKELFPKEADDPHFLKKQVALLSGGQKQRLNILRTIILNTPLLILDEPLNGLDFESIKIVLKMFEERQKQGAGILLISHNEEIFDKIAAKNKICYLKAEKIG
jgi:ABC-type dipeptide/oligopeptide/nickel transport system ATPase subunit